MAQLGTHRVRHHRVPALDNFPQKPRTDGIDIVGGENAGCEQIDHDVGAGVIVAERGCGEIQVHPELGGVDAGFLDLGEGHLAGVDIVHGKQALDAAPPRHAGQQGRHPVVAMNQIRPHPRNDVIDHLALENERNAHRLFRAVAVNPLAIVKYPVFGEVNVGFWQHLMILAQLLFVQVEHITMEHAPVIWQGHVDIRAELKQGGDQRGGHIGQTSGFGRHGLRQIAHARRQIGNFRGDDEDAWLDDFGAGGHGEGCGWCVGLRPQVVALAASMPLQSLIVVRLCLPTGSFSPFSKVPDADLRPSFQTLKPLAIELSKRGE